MIVLWSFYLFRFSESPATSEEQFNRPLAEKISDVNSPRYRAGLNIMARGHLFPRAYTWGMADTIRAGAEGRAHSVLAFRQSILQQSAFLYFPGSDRRQTPARTAVADGNRGRIIDCSQGSATNWFAPLLAMNGLAVLFLIVLMPQVRVVRRNQTRASRRPALALCWLAGDSSTRSNQSLIFCAARSPPRFIAALVSAIPVMRPWEYYNETVGGAANAHRYFNDEGIDLSLRTKELVEYYKQHLEPKGEVPYVIYFSPRIEWRRRGLDWVGKEPERDGGKIFGETLSGTFIIGAEKLAPSLWWDVGKSLREATPVARIGNLFVFRGTFPAPRAAQAYTLYIRAVHGKIYTAEPDVQGGIELLSRSVALDPKAFFVALELGNQYLKIGNREEALRAYRVAQQNAPPSDDIAEQLTRQIERVQSAPLSQVQLLRNPGLE